MDGRILLMPYLSHKRQFHSHTSNTYFTFLNIPFEPLLLYYPFLAHFSEVFELKSRYF